MSDKSQEIFRLRRSGLTLRDIADRVGLSYQRVQVICAEQPPSTAMVKRNGYGQVTVTADVDGVELATRVGKALERLGDEVEYE